MKVGQFVFKHDFDNEEWALIILRRIQENKIWKGQQVFDITNELINEVIGLRNKAKILINEKNVKKVVEANTKTKWNG